MNDELTTPATFPTIIEGTVQKGRRNVDAHGVPAQFLNGEATMRDYIAYFKRIDPKTISVGNYQTLADWISQLADALDIPDT